MDEFCTENNSLMRQFNKQVEKPSNRRNLSFGLELVDENHSNIDLKSSLLTRKQRLKEYLTTTHIPDKNINSTNKLHNFSTVNLINFVPKIDDYNKPVKVKSQWTRTSQMELALENSESLQTNNIQSVNNLSKYEKVNEVFAMAVSSTNCVINQINECTNTNNTRRTNKISESNLNFDKQCRVVVHKLDDNSVQVKRKRGRPRKIRNNIKDSTPINTNTDNQEPVKTNSIVDLKPQNASQPQVIKRGRGRPRKNKITLSTKQLPPSVPNIVSGKKRKARSSVIKNKRTKLISDQFKPEVNENSSSSDESEVNENGSIINNSPILIFPDDGVNLKCISVSRCDIPKNKSLITLGSCDRPYLQEKTESTFLKNLNGSNTQQNTTHVNVLEDCNNLNAQENITCANFLERRNNLNLQENTTDINFLEESDNLNAQENTPCANFLERRNNLNVQENTTDINFLEESDNLNAQENTPCANFLERRNNLNVQENTTDINFLEESDTGININESSFKYEQDVFSELEFVDWNPLPKRIRSNSVNDTTKIKNRRNSLSDNFVYKSSNNLSIIDDNTLVKSWKSLSYIESGPNILNEKIVQDELAKKLRSKLKRSRSFPHCLALDKMIWRFIVNAHESYSEENYEMISNLDSNMDVNVDADADKVPDMSKILPDRCDHHYRSQSVPVEQYKQPKENTSHMSRSLDNLNMLCSTNDPPSFQIPSNISNLKNSESDPEESEGKIRRSKRLNTKIKNSDILEEKYFLSSENSKIDSLLLADEIRKENEINLAEARANDPELDKKLKKLNFTLITNNLFRPSRKKMGEYTPAEQQELRRLKPRRTINSDTYKCHCKYTKKDWIEKKPGCAVECLNRLLNIECGVTCTLKAFCTNKQFQNKQFKRTKIIKTANKGYGVFAMEDIPSGTFVDEYMGEVIDQDEMIKRMKLKVYMFNNYMVQLKHDEIIDATRKGNITRFINHSCDPNCVAEKWNVLGESRMGFFSKQFIRKGEEITFDYSFEIFGDAAQQKCYCGSSKCRGFISKTPKIGDHSSSNESSSDDSTSDESSSDESSSDESDEHVDEMLKIKSDACLEKKRKTIKKITNKDKQRLRQLDKQLTDISKLKNKNRSDLESSTLNLNKLMVHITDSMSRSHILKFIRDNDLNCKRLFMNFNGLNIIHSWMTSNDNEDLKLEIVQTLADLPISNRNTITKSKVLDIIAQWANIPLNIKEVIENLEYPISQIKEHEEEVDKLLPDANNTSLLVQAARVLWKKWIVLKIVFKIPKLDRPKEVNIADDVSQTPMHLPQPKPNSVPHRFLNPTIKSSQPYKISCEQSQGTGYGQTSSTDPIKQIIYHHNPMNNRDRNDTVFEWNKKHWNLPVKTNKAFSSAIVNHSSNLVLNLKQSSTSTFKPRNICSDIPIIENSKPTKNMNWSNITEINLTLHDVSTNSSEKNNSKDTQGNKLFETKPTVYYPIEEIITTNQTWNLPPPTIVELSNGSTLHSMLKTVPPCLPNDLISNTSDETSQCIFSNDITWYIMRPENVMYDAQHPSIQEQLAFLPIDKTVNKSTKTQLDKPNINHEKTDSIENYKAIHPLDDDVRKKLFKQCEENVLQLVNKGILNRSKSAKLNYLDQSPIKILQSFFNKKIVTSDNIQNQYVLPNLIKRIKVISNCYRKQPSKIIEINNRVKSNSQKSKNDVFRIKEDQKTEKTDTTSMALILHNEQLSTVPETINLNKVLNKHSFKANTKNRFAFKILNGLIKHNLTMPKHFILKVPSDTKIITHNPSNELDIHYKLIPSVQNILCAKLNKGIGKDTINVYKQKIVMKYDETKALKPVSLRSILKENILSTNTIKINQVKKQLKRKMPLPPLNNTKNRKIVDLSVKNKSRNQATILYKTDDNTVFKKPMFPATNKCNSSCINTIVTSQEKELKTSSTTLFNSNANEFKQKPNSSSYTISNIDLLKISLNELREEPNTSNPLIVNIISSKRNLNEIRQKPLMKCSPFNKVDNILITELEQNAKCLASSISMDATDILPSVEANSELIEPIVENFKNSISQNKSMVRGNIVDDPIVRDYIQRTQLKTVETKRKCKLPESMMSLPNEVLDLVPDNQREIKYVIDFYHAMATVIVKVLDLYVKKSCKQGRIKNDDDFKYLAKKLNSNILFKELQVKKVEDLRISDSVKQKVELYIKKYMLKYGKVYRRKSTDQ